MIDLDLDLECSTSTSTSTSMIDLHFELPPDRRARRGDPRGAASLAAHAQERDQHRAHAEREVGDLARLRCLARADQLREIDRRDELEEAVPRAREVVR